jgi:ABC-type branched-subunit amino acid transport system permease subunit
VLIALALLPFYVGLYQVSSSLVALIASIAALGFNLLLGLHRLLSLAISAFFGVGA